jgi:hypothetical protein
MPRRPHDGFSPASGASVGPFVPAVGAGPGHVIAGQAPGVLFHATLADAEAAGTLPPELDLLVAAWAGATAVSNSSAPRLDRGFGAGDEVLAQVGSSAGRGRCPRSKGDVGTVRAGGLYPVPAEVARRNRNPDLQTRTFVQHRPPPGALNGVGSQPETAGILCNRCVLTVELCWMCYPHWSESRFIRRPLVAAAASASGGISGQDREAVRPARGSTEREVGTWQRRIASRPVVLRLDPRAPRARDSLRSRTRSILRPVPRAPSPSACPLVRVGAPGRVARMRCPSLALRPKGYPRGRTRQPPRPVGRVDRWRRDPRPLQMSPRGRGRLLHPVQLVRDHSRLRTLHAAATALPRPRPRVLRLRLRPCVPSHHLHHSARLRLQRRRAPRLARFPRNRS